MKKKMLNMVKAFMTGFIVVAIVLLLLHLFAPIAGIKYSISWEPTISLQEGATPIFNISWFAPILIGIIFALVQLYDDFEGHLTGKYRRVVKSEIMHEILTIIWYGLWGLALGFVISMFLFSILAGGRAEYNIPYLLSASVDGSFVKGGTAIITITTVLGLIYGLFEASRQAKKKIGKKRRR